MISTHRVLIVDDEKIVTDSLQQTLSIEGYETLSANSGADALALLQRDWPGIVITDINMPEMDGFALLERVRSIDEQIPVIVLTAFGEVPNVVSAMQAGAYDFLEKPFSTEHLIDTARRALEKRSLCLENRKLREEIANQPKPGPRILGNHSKMVELRSLLNKVKDANTDILVHGETGTGKELVARYLHQYSNRAEQPFVAINCGAIAQSLMESELFGHEAGAFTGAEKKRIGKIEYANGGTLFLDEIESMPMEVQINLLRVLEERKLTRLGSNQEINLDIRIIAATKEDLKAKADAGDFRLDLYYRLNIVEVHIPALRERQDDIIMLFEHFVWAAASRFATEEPHLASHHKQILLSREYPGNVRELRNLAECFVLLGAERAFGADHSAAADESSGMTLNEQMNTYEGMILRNALLENHGRLKDVQKQLGLARKTLYEKMKKHNLDKNSFKDSGL